MAENAAASGIGWRFDTSYAHLPDILHTRIDPVPVRAPGLVLLNGALADGLGLDFSGLSADETAALFAGNVLPDGALPLAQAYAGHQFGHLCVLGDGRAHVLGEHLTPDGRRVDIQLKGSGRTPYSRGGDGRAALGPMLREFIISEAMAALGIPTTRSLAVVTTGEPVLRETPLPGAVLTRVAASHLRVGTFEFAALHKEPAHLSALLDYAIGRHDPDLKDADSPALAFFEAVRDRQAALIVHWMRVGFIHGVMNTDNMTVSGETIDYGPCAFMDAYDPATVFSSIDHGGRYAYGNQPVIAQWNLARLAEALLPLISPDKEKALGLAQDALDGYKSRYETLWLTMMREKLGLPGGQPGDLQLANDFLSWVQAHEQDYTNTFRALSSEGGLEGGVFDEPPFRDWRARWEARCGREAGGVPDPESRTRMNAANPAVIPRNHKVEEALSAAVEAGDIGPVHALLQVLADPYAEREGIPDYQAPPAPSDRVYQTFCGT